MTSPPKILSQDHLNLLRNDILKFKICPLAYQTLIEWGFEKPDGVTIIDHFKDRKILENSGLKLGPWLKKNKEALDKTDFSSFDVTTLHDLLPVLCYEKVSQTGGKEWLDKLKDTNSIEYLLKEVKFFRNEVSHDYSKAIEDPKIKEKQKLLEKCIQTAGTLYGKDQSEIDGKIAHLEAKFDALVHGCTYESAVKHVKEFVEKENAPFMLEKYSHLFSIPLPGGLGKVGTAQIFESVNLSVKKKRTDFSSNEICNHVTNKFVVINGGPGSGKTTLLRNVYQNILDNSVNGSKLSFKGIDRFKVPIYLECRTERQNNLPDFLKESVPNINAPKDIIYDAFKEVEGKVFLIDGYDEVNDKSRELVKDAIDFCSKHNATCIVTGRVDAGNNFIRDLEQRNLSYDEMLIEQISELRDKARFLRRYGDKMGDGVDSEELVKSFENLNEAAQEVFSSPILLALFISLFLNNRNCLSQLHNEQSAYKAIREIFSKEIEEKLRESNVANPKLRTKDILAVFSYYSLLLFKRKEYFFREDDYDNLVRDCEEKLSKHVDFEKLLTCILTPETSLKQGKALTYAFTHSTIQEYLAVEQIIKNMRERNIDWNSEQLSDESLEENFLECLGVSTTHSDESTTDSDESTTDSDGSSIYSDESSTHSGVRKEVKRYGNINKLLMLEILDREEITTHRNTFTLMLKKYYKQEGIYGRYSPVYLLDLILSSDSNADIISIVSDCLRDREWYDLRYYRHIKPMADVVQTLKTAVEIHFSPLDPTNSQALTTLLSVLGDGSQIGLDLDHSYYNYKPLEGEFFTQLKKSKCKVTWFKACVSSEEHLNILVRSLSLRCDWLFLSCTSLYSFAVLKEYKGKYLLLRVKYSEDFSFTGNNPIPEGTYLFIDQIPANGNKDILFHLIKYLSPKSKEFWGIKLPDCHLTDSDAMELLEELHREKIRTAWGERTEVEEERVKQEQSRELDLYLRESEPTGRVRNWEESEEEESEEEESEEEESEEEE